jgi:predicted nucleic acid-binding protein
MFWDSSAIVPLLIEQAHTARAQEIWDGSKTAPLLWWGTPIECVSALARLEREQSITASEFDAARAVLKKLCVVSNEIQPSSMLREKAQRLLRLHPLRSADAQQLAAALIASEDLSTLVTFVCFDQKLANAARREGFHLLDEGATYP